MSDAQPGTPYFHVIEGLLSRQPHEEEMTDEEAAVIQETPLPVCYALGLLYTEWKDQVGQLAFGGTLERCDEKIFQSIHKLLWYCAPAFNATIPGKFLVPFLRSMLYSEGGGVDARSEALLRRLGREELILFIRSGPEKEYFYNEALAWEVLEKLFSHLAFDEFSGELYKFPAEAVSRVIHLIPLEFLRQEVPEDEMEDGYRREFWEDVFIHALERGVNFSSRMRAFLMARGSAQLREMLFGGLGKHGLGAGEADGATGACSEEGRTPVAEGRARGCKEVPERALIDSLAHEMNIDLIEEGLEVLARDAGALVLISAARCLVREDAQRGVGGRRGVADRIARHLGRARWPDVMEKAGQSILKDLLEIASHSIPSQRDGEGTERIVSSEGWTLLRSIPPLNWTAPIVLKVFCGAMARSPRIDAETCAAFRPYAECISCEKIRNMIENEKLTGFPNMFPLGIVELLKGRGADDLLLERTHLEQIDRCWPDLDRKERKRIVLLWWERDVGRVLDAKRCGFNVDLGREDFVAKKRELEASGQHGHDDQLDAAIEGRAIPEYDLPF